MDARQGDGDAVRGWRPSGLTTSGAARSSRRPSAPLHDERHRPEQTTLQHMVQRYAANFIAHTEAGTGAELPLFIKDEFDAFLECGLLAHGFPRRRCGECGHDELLAQ